jgi:hypothetical protein
LQHKEYFYNSYWNGVNNKMKISVSTLKKLIREAMEAMGDDEQTKRDADEEKAELERMQEPEEGEESPDHEGMGRHAGGKPHRPPPTSSKEKQMRNVWGRHPLEETIKLLVMEVLTEAKKYKGKSMRPGGGGRFAKFVDKLKSSGKSEESAKAIAAAAGREKYGAAKMKQMAKAGKKRAAKS